MTNQVRTALREKIGQQSSFLAPAVILLLAIADLLPREKKTIKADSVKIVLESGEEIDVTKHIGPYGMTTDFEPQSSEEVWARFQQLNTEIVAESFGIPEAYWGRDSYGQPRVHTIMRGAPQFEPASPELEELVIHYFGVCLALPSDTRFRIDRQGYMLDVRAQAGSGVWEFLGQIDLARETVGYVRGNPDNVRWEAMDPGYTPSRRYMDSQQGRRSVSQREEYPMYRNAVSFSNQPMMALGLCGPSRITYTAGAGPGALCDCSACRNSGGN